MTRLFIVPFLLVAFAGVWAPGASNDGMRIGLLLPPEESDAAEIRHGADLALELHNATSAVPARLVVRGRPGQWGDDGDEAGRLVLDDGMQILIAPPGVIPSHLVLQVAGRTQTPVISLSPEGSVTGAGVPWAVRLVPSIGDQARLLLPLAATWTVLVPEGRAGREAAADLTAAASAVKVSVGEPLAVGSGDADPRVGDAIAGGGKPGEGVLLWLPAPEAAHWAKRVRGAGHRGLLAGAAWLASERFVSEAGSAADGLLVVGFDLKSPDDDRATGYVAAFARRHGQPPDFHGLAAADAVALSLAILERACGRPPRVVFPLGDAGSGLTGAWRFDGQGNRLGTWRVLRRSGVGWTLWSGRPR
jgi:ABC-type branched-subunit amino acid transport system substrate-binding protein